jgi:hypothetical protein
VNNLSYQSHQKTRATTVNNTRSKAFAVSHGVLVGILASCLGGLNEDLETSYPD